MKKILSFLVLIFMPFYLYAATHSLQKVTVMLDWFPNPDHAPLFVAEQQGFFAQQGLEVKLIGPADPTDPPKLVAAGKADIAITYQPQFMEQVDQGLPLIQVGTLIANPLDCLVTLDSSDIKDLVKLKGKKIGSSSTGLGGVLLKTMLKNQGLTTKDVQIINVKYNLSQALLSHNVDAITGVMRNFEVSQIELTGHKVRTFYPEKNGVPTYNELIFVANKDLLSSDQLKAFFVALNQGVKYLKQHPEQAWLSFAKTHAESNNELNRRAWFATLGYFVTDARSINKDEWLAFAEFMQKNGLISKVQPIERYSINS